jgi:hypothetical protein
MANKIYPSNDAEFAVWLANFINKATTNKAILNLTDGQIAALEAKLTAFNADLALKQQKRIGGADGAGQGRAKGFEQGCRFAQQRV